MTAWDFFDAIYCINLDHRTDRWAAVTKQFESVGIADRVIRVPGRMVEVAPFPFFRPGEYGCLRSHLGILETIKHEGQTALVFEDDIEFFDVDVDDCLSRSIADLPNGWDLFYLGASEWKGSRYVYSNHLNVLLGAASAHSVAYNSDKIEELFDLAEEAMQRGFAIDKVWECIIQSRMRSFECHPMLTYHTEGYSDILKRSYKAY